MKAMGHNVIFDAAGQKGALNGGSTDMGKLSFCVRVITDNTNLLKGNVTYEVPGFHGAFYIPADGVNHTPEFTGGAGSPESFKRSIYSGAGMAVAGCQVLADDLFASAVKKDFAAVKP